MSGEFPVTMNYEFYVGDMNLCRNCNRSRLQHIDGKCLFEPTRYEVSDLRSFLEELLISGGTVEIKTSTYTMRQSVHGKSFDVREASVRTELVVNGAVNLERTDAAKRT